MHHPISSLLLVLTLLCGPTFVLAADLVLSQHYTAIEVSRDDSVHTGEDGLVIHPGDHYHDPCDNYQEGVKFTTTTGKSGAGEADGFLMVNDCRITKCRKWTTPDGEWGGETIVYDILPVSNNDTTRTVFHWSVLEETTCSCGEDCYVGKFLHVDDLHLDDRVKSANYRNYDACEAMVGTSASPASISCEAKKKGWKEHILTRTKEKDPWYIVGIGATVVVAYAIICCCCYCCFRRKKSQVTNEEPEEPENMDSWDIPVAGSEAEEESSQSSNNKTRWFGKRSAPEEVRTEEDSSQSSKRRNKRWFGKKASKEKVAMEKVEAKQSVDEQEQGLDIVGTVSKDVETGSVNTQAFNCSDCCIFG